jgi:hypothetical protein
MNHTLTLSILLLSSACVLEPQQLDFTILRQGAPSALVATDTAKGKTYPVTLSAGEMLLDEVRIDGFDRSPPGEFTFVTAFAQNNFDFVAQDKLQSKQLDITRFFMDRLDAIDATVSFAESTLTLTGVVTLTSGAQVNLTVDIDDSPRVGSEIFAGVTAGNRPGLFVGQISFVLTTLLDDVDFDSLGAAGDIVINKGSGDPAIDDALATIQENLFGAFSPLEL